MPEISFIENMSLQETEELVRANYTRIFKELTGQDAELGEADAKNLIIKSFSLVLYQVMQYVEAKGRAELLKTSTGDALDALAALFGITRQEARRATCIVRFTLSGQRSEPTAIPAGTRVKTQDGKYFNTVDYAEVTAGELTVDVDVQAEEAGAESSGIAAGEIDTLVDPIPYVASVESIEASTGGLDIEDDDGLTERVWLAPSKYSCAGPRDAYAYYVKEWRTDVDDVQIVRGARLCGAGRRRAANGDGAGGTGRLPQRRHHPPADGHRELPGGGGGPIRHQPDLLDRQQRPKERGHHSGPGGGGGGRLRELAAQDGTGHQPDRACVPGPRSGSQAREADGTGGHRDRKNAAPEAEHAHRDLRRA